jgi:predicted DNA-binding transcriptional regulator YafY
MPGPPGWGFPVDTIDLADLRGAIRSQAKLRIDYADAQGNRTDRVVWPLALGFMNEARVLVAWCEKRADYRSFRTDRIASARNAAERYPGNRGALLKAWRTRMKIDETTDFTPDKN